MEMEDLAKDLWVQEAGDKELSYHSILVFMTEKLSEQEKQIAELKELMKEIKRLETYTTGSLLRRAYHKIKRLWSK